MSANAPPFGAVVHNRRGVDTAVLAVCVVAAFVLRAWALSNRNLTDFDETYLYMLGRSLLTGHGYTLNGLPCTAFAPLYPVLVGVAGFFTSSTALATSGISALAGGLLPLPVYLLARDIHGRRAALLAAGAAAVWRGLFFFAASNVRYVDRLYVGPEPLYVTLVAWGLLYAYRFAYSGGRRNAALSGVFLGLSSLARFEGIILLGFVFAWLLVVSLLSGRLRSKEHLLQVGIIVAMAVLCLSPFLIYVRAVTGRWVPGAPPGGNPPTRDATWVWVTSRDTRSYMEGRYALNDDNTEMADPYWGVSSWHRAAGSDTDARGFGSLTIDWRWLRLFTDFFWNVRRPLVPQYAWALVVLGLLMPPWTRRRFLWWTLAIASCAAIALFAASFYALARHGLPLLVLFAIGVGKGLESLTSLFHRAAVGLFEAKGLVAAGLSLVPALVFFIVMADSGARMNSVGNRRPGLDPALSLQTSEKRLAAFINSKLPPGSTLMCHPPWLALWAGMEWRVSPYTSPARLLEYARSKGIDYAVLYSWQMGGTAAERSVLQPYIIGETEYGDRQFILRFTDRSAQSPAPL